MKNTVKLLVVGLAVLITLSGCITLKEFTADELKRLSSAPAATLTLG
jgi:hypothetical protein